MTKTVDLDDLAAALLMTIAVHSPNSELAGAILPNGTYKIGDVTLSGKDRFEARIPAGAIAIGHNHPDGSKTFSAQDVATANQIQKTSYIGATKKDDPAFTEVRRYDPGYTKTFTDRADGKTRSFGDPVLAQFPIDEYLKLIMHRMGREDNDPRGALLEEKPKNEFEKMAVEMETDN